jgi:hypothetical protein
MDDPQPVPLWLIPMFPLFFAAMWMLVTGFLAEVGGWSALAQHYREPAGIDRRPVRSFRMASMDLRRGWMPLPANYGNCVVLDVGPAGLHLRVWRPFRFRHPPLLIPWSQVEQCTPGWMFFWRTLTVHPREADVRIRLYGGAAGAVEEVWQQLAARSPEPAVV